MIDTILSKIRPVFNVENISRLILPALILLIIIMMVVPLPVLLLDMLFTVNIALALVVVMISINTQRPLDFFSFPTVLLFATLLRLGLNVASTRVVLVDGHTGADAAGQVIKAFGDFVIGGNYLVGIIVFFILMIINFMVVTKGAGRVSEVSARFTLDAMPGKQMAIDADLNAGVLTQEEAKQRRAEVSMEADFYGSMDGASKFVKGDALAGLLILLINLVGGLAIGIGTHDMAFSDAVRVYTLLTIGDGLVAQIPSLLLSTATAIIVTRVSSTQALSGQVVEQLGSPQALFVTAGVLVLLGLIPGMPNLVFLSLGVLVGGLGYLVWYRQKNAVPSQPKADEAGVPQEQELTDLTWEDIPQLDLIGLEVGYALISLVDQNQGGLLMQRIKGVRKKLSHELGFLIPSIHIRDNLDLTPNQYHININGVIRGKGELMVDRDLAINPGSISGDISGIPTRDPAFGLDAIWIERDQREYAQTMGYTVVDVATALATHINRVIQENAHELLGYDTTQQLLDQLALSAPKLVESTVPKQLSIGIVTRVLQNLLAEQIPVRDIRNIVEILAEQSAFSQDPDTLTALVRSAMGRMIVQKLAPPSDELKIMTLGTVMEQTLHDVFQKGQQHGLAMEPNLAEQLLANLQETCERLIDEGIQPILVVAPAIRHWLSKTVRHRVHGLTILGYDEIPDEQSIRVVSTIEQQALPNLTQAS